MPVRQRERRARGFTLLEVLVAFAIAAFALVAVLQAVAGGVGGGQAAARKTGALLLAQSRLAEATVLPPGERKGTDAGYRWRTLAVPEGPASQGGLRLYRYEVSVMPDSGTALRLTTLRLRRER